MTYKLNMVTRQIILTREQVDKLLKNDWINIHKNDTLDQNVLSHNEPTLVYHVRTGVGFAERWTYVKGFLKNEGLLTRQECKTL